MSDPFERTRYTSLVRGSQPFESLRAIFGERLSTKPAVLEQHGRGESLHPSIPPQAVAWAETKAEVVAAVRTCFEHRIPIIPFGAGTSLEGHLAAIAGGLCLDLSRLSSVQEVRPEDLLCRVEPGVTREQLNLFLRDTGLFFPVDPGAEATLGGMAATGASGTTTIRYGTMRDNVVGLEVVLPYGKTIRTAREARKSSAGYDLTHLFVGSEGTLGIITELTLRLHPRPEIVGVCRTWFGNLAAAVDTVIETIQCGIPVARIELLDERQVHACNQYSKLQLPESPTLFLEFHGTEPEVTRQFDLFSELASGNSAGDVIFTTDAAAAKELWKARHNALPAAKALRTGSEVWVTDVCVPISRLTECIVDTREDLDRTGLTATIVGHVGEGNFHVFLMIDIESRRELDEAEAFSDRLVRRALRLQGTCTGEHGIGMGKKKYLELELGTEAIALMRRLKDVIDDRGIMNPGKIFQYERGTP